jgi:hypothetical protein
MEDAVRARWVTLLRAPRPFADGRILAYPPTEDSNLPRFVVHPLLERDVDRIVAAADDGGNADA